MKWYQIFIMCRQIQCGVLLLSKKLLLNQMKIHFINLLCILFSHYFLKIWRIKASQATDCSQCVPKYSSLFTYLLCFFFNLICSILLFSSHHRYKRTNSCFNTNPGNETHAFNCPTSRLEQLTPVSLCHSVLHENFGFCSFFSMVAICLLGFFWRLVGNMWVFKRPGWRGPRLPVHWAVRCL